jgi:carbamoyl-phosphate synthase small subunit
MKTDYLLLEDGTTFEGKICGAIDCEALGEVVFNTSMSGYQEILTDPSYAGQIVTMTYTQIGNYGVNNRDVESSKVHCKGMIVRELSEISSNFTSTLSLEQYFIKNNIACMSEIDTRALTRYLRDKGALKGIFVKASDLKEEQILKLEAFDYDKIDFSIEVAGLQKNSDYTNENGRPKVAVLDFGIKNNILRILSQFCNVEVFSLKEWQSLNAIDEYDGFFLSNGPGDPAAVVGAKESIQAILATNKPVFGICLGHQLLSLSLGAKTYKLKFGHHGANHPVKNLKSERVEISSQNHGFAVEAESLPNGIIATHINLNDGSLAGLELENKPVYSIQYHPESAPGPHDANYLFDKFATDLGVK